MDFTPIYTQFALLLSIVLTFTFSIAFFKSSWFKGILGEILTETALRIGLSSSDYNILSDVTLEVDGSTTQIDHVVFSRYGIFVIETKNMKGWIYASTNSGSWTQRIYNRSYKFQNPIRQNLRRERVMIISGV